MPHVVNGIGTWYWGKDRIHQRMGTCESCGRQVTLRSYDTTLFFVVVFIPIIPLGRKRIINECSSCKRHRQLPLKKWLDLQDTDITTASKDAAADPRNEEKAAKAIATATAYQARDEFMILVEKFAPQFPRGATFQAVLGDSFAFFGMPQEAEDAYRKSLAAKPDDNVHQALALLMVRENRPADAVPHVQHIFDQQQAGNIGLVQLVAASSQSQGMHREALELLDRTAAVFPSVSMLQDFQKLRTTSEKHLDTGKRISNPALKYLGAPKVSTGGFFGRLPRLIPIGLAIAAIAWYLGSAITLGMARPVWLVNGLDRAYTVAINGKQHRLPPHSHQLVKIGEGNVILEIPELNVPPKSVAIRTPFFSRPFDGTVHVINPDGTAFLIREQTIYTIGGGGGRDQPYSLLAGKPYYAVQKVDYAFLTFPPEIKMKKSDGEITKTRLADVTSIPFMAMIGGLVDEPGGLPQAIDALKNRLSFEPEDLRLLAVAAQLIPPEQAVPLFQSRLGQRPVLMEWHRGYQELMERTHPEVNLRAEYQKMLDAEPTSPELSYLLGRTIDDRLEARPYFERAANAQPKPVAYGFHALAFDELAAARYEQALELENKALALSPGNPAFEVYLRDALLGAGKLSDLLERVRNDLKVNPKDGDAFSEELYIIARTQGAIAARQRASQYYDLIRKQSSEAALVNLQSSNEAMIAYVQGDEAQALRSYEQMKDNAGAALATALLKRQYDDAAKLLKGADQTEGRGIAHALLYIAAMDGNDSAVAKAALDNAIQGLKRERRTRLAADWLAGISTPTEQQLLDLASPPESKRLILAAIGLNQPAAREKCFELARKLNIDTRFPYLLVERVTKKSG